VSQFRVETAGRGREAPLHQGGLRRVSPKRVGFQRRLLTGGKIVRRTNILCLKGIPGEEGE